MRVALALAALLVVSTLAYAPLRTASFVYEDVNAVVAHPGVSGGQQIFVDRARWLSALSHRVVWTLAGRAPLAHHVVNLALHQVNGLLVFAIASAFVGAWPALLTAALFLLHPLQTEAVAYVASRSELLAATCALLAYWLALKRPFVRRTYAVLTNAGVWLCVLLAVSAKESAVVVVPLIAATAYFRGERFSRWRLAALIVPIALIAATVLRRDYLVVNDLGPIDFAATQAAALFRYLALALVPIGQSVDHDFDLVPWLLRYVALYALIAIACGAFLLGASIVDGDTHWRGRLWDDSPRLRVCAFGVAWVLIAFLPRLVMRIPEVLNEHQTYLPFVGVWLVAAVAVGGTD